jgi:hypothetical protein
MTFSYVHITLFNYMTPSTCSTFIVKWPVVQPHLSGFAEVAIGKFVAAQVTDTQQLSNRHSGWRGTQWQQRW